MIPATIAAGDWFAARGQVVERAVRFDMVQRSALLLHQALKIVHHCLVTCA